jgi:hypothetical protein
MILNLTYCYYHSIISVYYDVITYELLTLMYDKFIHIAGIFNQGPSEHYCEGNYLEDIIVDIIIDITLHSS